jgi:hypothetical protein
MPAITRNEWVRVIALAMVVIALTSLPYALGFARSNADYVYSGATLDLVDYNSYLTKMQQGLRGEWRFSFIYTSEEHTGVYVYPFYLLLGHIARLIVQSLPLVYQAARVLCALAMMLTMYMLIAQLISYRALRWIAYVLVCAGSGLGWLQLLVAPTLSSGVSPIDFWLIDGFPFFSVLTFPHFTASIALMALAFSGLLGFLTRPAWQTAALMAVCSFMVTAIHPFTGGLVVLIAVLYMAVHLWAQQITWRRAVSGMLALTLPAGPVLIYDVWSFNAQPAFRIWSQQLVMPSPPPGYYLASYGLLLFLALFGVVRVLRRREWPAMLAVIWLVVVIPLLYAPTRLQRRFLEGVMLPLCILASMGVAIVLRKLFRSRRWRRRLLILTIALMLPSNLALVAGTSMAAWNRSPSVFYPGTVVAAVDWLGANAKVNDVILSSFEVGNVIPARTGLRVVLGHWIETLDYERKSEQVRTFFNAATSDEKRRAFLKDERVNWVFFGPDERKLGTFDPSRVAYLGQVFRTNDVAVYRVESP